VKILLFGVNGQIGNELCRTLLPLGQLTALGREEIDLSDTSKLSNTLQVSSPDIIVNAAAYTSVDEAEANESAVYKINVEAVDAMAGYSRENNILLVHYSSDYVFDGKKTGAYAESDATNPLNVYGRSKCAAEEVIESSGCNALMFRTSWVFSAHGHNFIKTILRLAKERENLNVIADQYGVPTSAELIADVTALSISAQRNKSLPNGLYHLTSAGRTTWYDIACHVVLRAINNGASLALKPECISAITAAEYPQKTKRPSNSCLSSSSLCTALGLDLPDWKIHVNRVVDKLTRTGALI